MKYLLPIGLILLSGCITETLEEASAPQPLPPYPPSATHKSVEEAKKEYQRAVFRQYSARKNRGYNMQSRSEDSNDVALATMDATTAYNEWKRQERELHTSLGIPEEWNHSSDSLEQ